MVNKFYEDLAMHINDAFDNVFGRKPLKPTIKKSVMQQTQKPIPPTIYESIEDYTKQTGKRFRMTKDQKSRELTREEAFMETWRTA